MENKCKEWSLCHGVDLSNVLDSVQNLVQKLITTQAPSFKGTIERNA